MPERLQFREHERSPMVLLRAIPRAFASSCNLRASCKFIWKCENNTFSVYCIRTRKYSKENIGFVVDRSSHLSPRDPSVERGDAESVDVCARKIIVITRNNVYKIFSTNIILI